MEILKNNNNLKFKAKLRIKVKLICIYWKMKKIFQGIQEVVVIIKFK